MATVLQRVNLPGKDIILATFLYLVPAPNRGSINICRMTKGMNNEM